MKFRPLTTTLLCTLAGFAANAFAGDNCDAAWIGLPDFDQNRGTGVDPNNVFHTGLPGDGASHCFPASAMNILGFLTNNGYPSVMNGPRDWYDPSNYNFVTSNMYSLGDLMDTTVDDGTTISGWVDGMRIWLDFTDPEQFVVGAKGLSSQWMPITPKFVYDKVAEGSLTAILYGRYTPEGPGPFNYLRTGGHACTVRHVYDACSNSAEMALRNPSNSSSLVTQSNPDFSISSMSVTVGNYRLEPDSATVYNWINYKFNDFTPPGDNVKRILDGAMWVTPAFSLDVEPQLSEDAGINIVRPVQLTNGPHPTHSRPLPGVGRVVDIAIDAALTNGYIRAAGTRIPAVPPSIWLLNLTDGSAQRVATPQATDGPMCVGRFGDVYFADGSRLTQTRPLSGGTGADPGCDLPQPALDIAYDDSSDTVVVCSLSPAGGYELTRVLADLNNPRPRTAAIPTTVNIVGVPHIIVDPSGEIWLSSSQSTDIYRLAIPATGPCQTREHILLARQVGVLQLSDSGSLLYASEGMVRQLKRGASGGWSEVRTSPFAGTPGSSFFTIAKGRVGHDASILATNRSIDESDLPSARECPVDFNEDGGIDGADVGAFFDAWSAGEMLADMNNDGGIDGSDVEAFFLRWEAGSCE